MRELSRGTFKFAACLRATASQFGQKAGALVEGLLSGPVTDLRTDRSVGMSLREVCRSSQVNHHLASS